ncbi:hypothetical protein [Pontitalea aquivivens]|uniref:hypothetical protein n=1 Tax=Pontitalea aquivivens TaxID=3388663 RepID=UPI003970C409
MTPICTIRRLRTDDRTEWGRLWTGYLDYYQTSVADAVCDSTFSRLLGQDPQDFNAMIAEVNRQPVGLVH